MTENKGKRISVSQLQKRAMDELKSYRAIGTVEECRAAVERQKHIDTPTGNEDSVRAVQWLKDIAENRRVSLYCAEECANILLNMLAAAEQ